MADYRGRVLVADHDREFRLLLSSLAGQAGFEVDAVADGPMALTMVRSRAPDVAIVDSHLPQVDGFAVCTAIKSDPATERIAVVLLAAQATEEAKTRSREVGADEFVAKPFSAEALLDLVEQLLHIRKVAQHLDIGAGAVADAFGGDKTS